MKQRTRVISLLLAVLLFLLPSMSVSAETWVDLGGDGTEGSIDWDKNNMTESFSVVVDADVTEVKAYKIVDITYVKESDEFSAVWASVNVNDEEKWVAKFVEDNYSKYPSPEDLAAATQKEQDAFYGEKLQEFLKTNATEETLGDKLTSVVLGGLDTTSTEETKSKTFTFSGDFGQYLVLAKDSAGTQYSPLTVEAAPYRDAGTGKWMIKYQTIKMKFSDVDITKKISDDQVAVGDTVTFTIDAEVPNYSANMASDKKVFIIDDDMSTAFSYDAGSLKITGTKTVSGGEVTEEIPSEYFTPVISSDVSVYSCSNKSHQYFNIYMVQDGGIYYFYYLKDGMMKLLSSTTKVTSSTLAYTGTVYQAYKKFSGDNINHGLSKLNVEKNIFNINFDYEALAEAGYSDIHIEYTATVTEKAEVGTDNNTNTAYLYYAKDIDGTVGSISDTVTAWTYGVNLIKVDGDTVGADGTMGTNTKYLAGATFILYKKVSEYKGYTNTTDLGKNSTYNADVSANELLGKIRTIPVYGTTDGSGQAAISGYELYLEAEDNIVTTADSTGIQVSGLDPGVYLLEETIAPQGYNLLAQALQFEIKEDELEKNDDGEDIEEYGKRDSLAAFTDEEDKTHATGYYDLVVKNYKGLTLPETGGIGTTMFTVIGMMLMAGAAVILYGRRRRMS